MIIYGAGMAGLLAAHVLRRFDPVVCEAQEGLPNNHAALLRFRTEAASIATNIPFKKVQVRKLISHAGGIYTKSNLKLSNMYSQKVSGKVIPRSIDNLDTVGRFIAPSNFIYQMSKGLDIEYNSPLTSSIISQIPRQNQGPIISTIPMNIMMKMVGWKDMPEFKYKTIWSVWGKIKKPEMEIYDTVYYPDYDEPYYRVSITGDTYIAEYIEEPKANEIAIDASAVMAREFGIHSTAFEQMQIKRQEYGKLLPIDDNVRKEFIIYLTDRYRIYSLGRFATWRQLLLDDIVNDVKVIENLVEHRDVYNRRLFANGER